MRKNCNKCHVEKSIDNFYSTIKKKTNGEEFVYYRPDCIDCTKSSVSNWRKKNPEKLKALNDRYNKKEKNRQIKREFSEKVRQSGDRRQWELNNRDKISQYRLNRSNKHHDIADEEWKLCKTYFDNDCAYCGMPYDYHKSFYKQDLHKEHVDPNGSDKLDNCVPSCRICNSEKHIYNLLDWYSSDNPKFSEKRLSKIIKWLDMDYKISKD